MPLMSETPVCSIADAAARDAESPFRPTTGRWLASEPRSERALDALADLPPLRVYAAALDPLPLPRPSAPAGKFATG